MKIEQLQAATGMSAGAAKKWHEPLLRTFARYGINTPARQADFLAQVGHESGGFQWVKELGSQAYLAKYDTGALAKKLGNTPEADGDGQLYAGRGLIQVTGRTNYLACSKALFGDDRLLRQPQLLEQPEFAALSAGWYWDKARLNSMADSGAFEKQTRAINGGLNGLEDRKVRRARARRVLLGG